MSFEGQFGGHIYLWALCIILFISHTKIVTTKYIYANLNFCFSVITDFESHLGVTNQSNNE